MGAIMNPTIVTRQTINKRYSSIEKSWAEKTVTKDVKESVGNDICWFHVWNICRMCYLVIMIDGILYGLQEMRINII